jgi:topoisomerase IV subunit B
MGERWTWANTTHDWAMSVDHEHLRFVRERASDYGPTVEHLVLEIMAYANDEADSRGRPGNCTVTLHTDGSISVVDDGRGTDTRRDDHGQIVRKPVMATKDLRFFDQGTDLLPDGRTRRGASVVAALSTWLEHTNYRLDGAWTQRYERGAPVGDLVELPPTGFTGTRVRFRPDERLVASSAIDPASHAVFPSLTWRMVSE